MRVFDTPLSKDGSIGDGQQMEVTEWLMQNDAAQRKNGNNAICSPRPTLLARPIDKQHDE